MGEAAFMPCLVRLAGGDAGGVITLGHPLLDAYVELVTARPGGTRCWPPRST